MREQTEMIWACDEVREIKSSKSNYDNERRREKKKWKTKKERVGYD